MRSAMAKVAAVLVAAALTVVAARAGACEEPLVVGYTKWPPFDMVESNRVSGINGDVLRAVAERMGCALRWRYRPWRRLLAELRKGELDVTGAAHRTEERQRYARFSESYMPYKAVLFVDSRNATEYATLHDFLEAGNHLAVVSKYTYGEDTDTLLDEPAYRGQVFEMYAADESVRALAHDRVDGLIGNPYVTRYFADEQDALGQIRAT